VPAGGCYSPLPPQLRAQDGPPKLRGPGHAAPDGILATPRYSRGGLRRPSARARPRFSQAREKSQRGRPLRRQQCRRFTPSRLPQTPGGGGRTRSRLRLAAALHRSPGSRTAPLPRRRDRPHDWMRPSQNNWSRHPMPMPGRQGRPIEGGSLIRRALASSLQDPLFDGVVALACSARGRRQGRRWARDEISPLAEGRICAPINPSASSAPWGLMVTFGTTSPGTVGRSPAPSDPDPRPSTSHRPCRPTRRRFLAGCLPAPIVGVNHAPQRGHLGLAST